MLARGLCLGLLLATPARGDSVEFNRDVRPILSDACFACHGPDARQRKADLRLDVEGAARAALGKPHDSELLRRVATSDPKKRMPPARAARQLSAGEIDTLHRWVEQGAPWQKHWAFLTPKRPRLPTMTDRSWARSPLDAFVLAKLDREGLRPSPPADPLTLLRRVTLDLTGVPPSVAEADAFLADREPGAYERAVDRLLDSPRYGERMAVRWLDAARYADTSGYQTDGDRVMWRWRDWVIEAYNHNKPYDRFTVEQLAGDLLPGATLDQVIATGFNRNHRGNAEGGIVPEEYAVEYVADRAETTATVWLGLTMTCARCHDHKYDPVTQKDFYRLFAFFNNVPERGKAIKVGNSPPYVATPTRSQAEHLAALERKLAEARRHAASFGKRLARAQERWEGAPMGIPAPVIESEPGLDDGDFGFFDRFTLEARVKPDERLKGTILSRMADEPRGEGYAVVLETGRVQVNLVKRWLDDAIRVETEERLRPDEWRHVLVTYDGSRIASGVRVYLDGRLAKLRVLLDDLNQTFQTKHGFRVGAGNGPDGRFRGKIQGARVHARDFSDEDAAVASVGGYIHSLVNLGESHRTPAQSLKLRRYYLANHAPAEIRQAHERVSDLERQGRELLDAIPTTMVMSDARPRPTHVLLRGQYDRPGEKVSPGVPATLSAWKHQPDRLGLARWVVAGDNPLAARVAVNRLWQMLFGVGLVKTTEDFGLQGEMPSHPELLDWLAVEFRESGWDVKRLLRLIVTSAAYRQASRVTPELLKRDPENRLLARGPRSRLPAEMIRDQALAASGLIAERLGGPSVKPYQPAGLWRELADAEYVRDRGEALYRRGLYVFWKRTVAPPSLVTFDAAGREACTVRETRTNTPLQALTLLNDVTYVEAARALAQRVMREAATPEERLTRMFRLVLTRPPRPAERGVLLAGLERHRAHYVSADRGAAIKLLGAGDAPVDSTLCPADLAAYTTMASIVLNLDEAITKE
ncbi:MAG: DUF1553 domain-containing protein [Gemmataceae bacterium]